jgi:hypothetical protein
MKCKFRVKYSTELPKPETTYNTTALSDEHKTDLFRHEGFNTSMLIKSQEMNRRRLGMI